MIEAIGLDSKVYSGHSFIIGGATTAAAAGLSALEPKLLERWSSDAYLGYIRTPSNVYSDLQNVCHRIEKTLGKIRSLLYTHK